MQLPPLRHEYNTKTRPERKHQGPNSTAEYLAELDRDQLLKLKLFYLPDFELFGYPVDEIPVG